MTEIMTRSILKPATDSFCIQDCRSQMVQVEYQGHTRNSRILGRKPLINIAFDIDWS